MQNDLISRSALIEQLKKENAYYNPHINEIIINMPTAYDVEKVVTELKEVSYNGFDLRLSVAEVLVRNGGKE